MKRFLKRVVMTGACAAALLATAPGVSSAATIPTSSAGTIPSSTVNVAAVSSLPFSFYFEVSYGLYSRLFKTTTGRICIDLKAYKLRDEDSSEPALNNLPMKLINNANGAQVAGTINVPYDNVARSWCWTGLNNSLTYKVYWGFGNQGGGLYIRGDGQMRAS